MKEAIGNFKRRFDGLEFFRGVHFWFFMRLAKAIENLLPQKAVRILETVLEFAPGLSELKLRLAKLKLKLNDVDAASKLLYLHKQGGKLLARLKFKQGHIDEALTLLQADLSASGSPLYLLLLASRDYERHPGDPVGSLNTLGPLLDKQASPGSDSDREDMGEVARLGVKLGVAAKDAKRARRFLTLARPEALPLLQADVLILENEPEKAIAILQAMLATSGRPIIWPRRVEIAQKLADIYLVKVGNKDKFIKVFLDLVVTAEAGEASSTRQTPETRDRVLLGASPGGRERISEALTLLGEAYLRVQQPQEAVATFRKATAETAGGSGTMESWLRLGRALVKVHEFQSAFDLLADLRNREELSKSEKFQVRRELCQLLVAMGREEEAAAEWQAQIDLYSVVASEYRECGAVYEELAKVEDKLFQEGRRNQVVAALEGALGCFSQVRGEEGHMSEISLSIAQHFEQINEVDHALKWYAECVRLDRSRVGGFSERAQLAMTNVHLAKGDVAAAEAVLKTNPKLIANEEFADQVKILKAEIALLQHADLQSALDFLLDVLKTDPGHPVALIKAVGVVRRLGLPQKARDLVLAARNAARAGGVAASAVDFAAGLLCVWAGDAGQAKVFFGRARNSSEHRLDATLQLIELLVFADSLPVISMRSLTKTVREVPPAILQARLAEIEDLAQDVAFHPRAQTLLAFAKILVGTASGGPTGTTMVTSGFARLTESAVDKDNISLLTFVAMANVVTGQTTKARPLLKRVQELAASIGYSVDEAEDVIRAMVLAADLFFDQGKMDVVTKLCQTVLAMNKAVPRVYELLGEVAEKANDFETAAGHFRRAARVVTDFGDADTGWIKEVRAKEAHMCCRAGLWTQAVQVARKAGERQSLEHARSNLRN
jgi:tetratricopeptide (TPR) repeat protein